MVLSAPGDVSGAILLPLLPPEQVVLLGDPVRLSQGVVIARRGKESEIDGKLLHLPELSRHEADGSLW